MKPQTPIACLVFAITLAAVSPPAVANTVLITGANSGIGLELVRQYAVEDWTVIATHRRDSMPESLARLAAEYDNVRVEKIDVTDVATITAVVDKLDGMPIDILINNAGIVGALTDLAQQFGQLDFDQFERYMDVNMAGRLRMSEAFYNNVAASEQKKIVAISSVSGSIGSRLRIVPGQNGPPPRFWYDTSKAALNMASTRASDCLGERLTPDGKGGDEGSPKNKWGRSTLLVSRPDIDRRTGHLLASVK